MSNIETPPPPYTVYKSDISYFSGKLEAYLRYKAIPHRVVDAKQATLVRIAKHTGTQKMPAIEMDSGEWLFDTTPTIQWLEDKHPDNRVIPEDPALRFLALLLEDYADEWMWRPAMWWRWVPKVSRVALGRRIAGDMLSKWLAIPVGFYFARRQLHQWLWNDGVTQHNSSQIRDQYFQELEFMEAQLAEQDFILGKQPSIADFGFFGPMFRHFGNDPDAAEVMRRKGPRTYEWLARLWNVKASDITQRAEWKWPAGDHWDALLKRIACDYIPYLEQNALAFAKKDKRFDYAGASFDLKGTVTTHYRVWCREQLQTEYQSLNQDSRAKINSLFAPHGGLDLLANGEAIDSGLSAGLVLPVSKNRSFQNPSLKTRLLGQPRN